MERCIQQVFTFSRRQNINPTHSKHWLVATSREYCGTEGEGKNPKAKLGLYQIFLYNLSGDFGHDVDQLQNKKHKQGRYTKPFFN